jgi:hypothetical protein
MLDRVRLRALPAHEALVELGTAVVLGHVGLEGAMEIAADIGIPPAQREILRKSVGTVYGETARGVVATAARPLPANNLLSVRGPRGAPVRFEPRAGVDFPVRANFRGREQQFSVRFGLRLVERARREGLTVDLATGELRRPNGEPDPRCAIADARRRFERLTGTTAPGWILMHPGTNTFCWPAQEATLDGSKNGVTGASTRGGVRFVFTHRLEPPRVDSRRFDADSLQPVPAERWRPATRDSLGLRFEASSARELEQAVALAKTIIGSKAESWPVREAELKNELAGLDAFVAEQPGVAGVAGVGLGAVEARRDELRRILAPVRVIVVPDGKHYTAMPQLAHVRDALLADGALGDAASIVVRDPVTKAYARLVLLPAGDLAKAGLDSRHELYHLLEDRFLSSAEVESVDGAYRRALEAGGPFSRPYGMQRAEFFTTMGEEFEGGWGPEGPRWLLANHPRLYEVFCDVTGKKPV